MPPGLLVFHQFTSTRSIWDSSRSLVPVLATWMISYHSVTTVPYKSVLPYWWNVISYVVSISNPVWVITDSGFEALGQWWDDCTRSWVKTDALEVGLCYFGSRGVTRCNLGTTTHSWDAVTRCNLDWGSSFDPGWEPTSIFQDRQLLDDLDGVFRCTIAP